MQQRPASAASARGARAVDQESVLAMHRVLFSSEREFPCAWARQGFTLRGGSFACGLKQHQGGPCGVLAVVQAMLVRHISVGGVLAASSEAAASRLIDSLAGIVWSARVGRLATVVSCRAPELPPMREAGDHLVQTSCRSEEEVRGAIQAAAGAYTRPSGGGVALLLYSMLLTRGLAMVARDADFPSPLVLPNGYCAQELVNFLLCGRAYSNVFDGERVVGEDGDGSPTRLRGIPRPVPVGFLTLFERQGSLLPALSGGDSAEGCVTVGSHLKQPEHPVYVIQSEAHYSVLWLASDAPPELDVADTFDVLYFDQLAEAEHPTRLTLRRGHSPPSHPPPLESVLLTRWPAAAVVDWNGAEPLL